MSTVKNDIQSTGYTGQGNSVGTLQGTNGETSTIVPSDKEWDDMWENLSKPQTQSEILDQRETVNLQKDEQQTSTSETSDAEIAHTDQPEDSNKPSGSEPASINANNPEESDASKIENASTSGTTDAQGIDKSEQTAAEEVAPGITHDKVNDGYQTDAGGIVATFKNLDDAKAYQELLTGFKYDGEGQQIELLNYRSCLQDDCQDRFIGAIIGSIMNADRVVVGNEKTLRGLQQRTDSTAKQTLEKAKAKGQDKFWGCQAPNKGKLMAAKLMKEQQRSTANLLEQIGPESELGKLKSERDAIKSGLSLDEIKSQKEEIERTISECFDRIHNLEKFAKKHTILATIFGEKFSTISQSLLAKINTLSTKYANLNRAEIDLMELPNKEIQIRDKEEQVFQGFAKSLIDLSTKKDYHATFLEGTLESDSIPGGRTYSSMLDGLSTAIGSLLKDANNIITATTLKNFAKTYGEEYLLKAVKAACTLPDSRDKVLQAFNEYWGNNHSQEAEEKPCPYVLVLEKGLNDIALEYKDLLGREEALTKELSQLRAEWKELSSSEYSDVAEVEEKINELEQKIHGISTELQKIPARKTELEKQFESDYKSKGKIEGDAYVLNIGSRTIMTQPDQAGIITLKSLGAFAEKLPKSPVKQPAA